MYSRCFKLQQSSRRSVTLRAAALYLGLGSNFMFKNRKILVI